MRRFTMAVALFVAAILVAGALAGDDAKKPAPEKVSRKDVGKMMKDIHSGEKSAYSRVNAELKKDEPNWEKVAKDVKQFAEMSAAFKKAPLGYTSPALYISSSEGLSKAVGKKDKKAAAAAFAGLTNSCNSCHYGGAKAMLR